MERLKIKEPENGELVRFFTIDSLASETYWLYYYNGKYLGFGN